MTTEELKQAELLVRILETGLVSNDRNYKALVLSQLSNLLISEMTFESYKGVKSTENTSDKFVDSLDDVHLYSHFLITRTDNKGCVQTFTEKLHTEKSMYLKYLHDDKDIKGLRGFNSVR